MKKITNLMIVSTLLSTVCVAQEISAQTSVKKVSLFKNGLVYVKAEVKVDGKGSYLLEEMPIPVYGTVSVDNADVSLKMGTRMITQKRSLNNQNFQSTLEGQKVTIYFSNSNDNAITGVVKKVVYPELKKEWDRNFNMSHNNWNRNQYLHQQNAHQNPGRYLIVESENGDIEYIASSSITRLKVSKIDGVIKLEQPVTLAEISDSSMKTFSISYLAKGMTWSPSYHVSLLNDKELSFEQKAVVKNELIDLSDSEVSLVSGFSNVKYSNVDSLFSQRQTIANYLLQLTGSPFNNNNVGLQNAGVFSGYGGSKQSAVQPAMEGPDIYHHSVGKKTLKRGESIHFSVAKEKASYERIVEWVVKDYRDLWGRYSRNQDINNVGTAWDALRFNNPLAYPVTTGAALVESKGALLSQGSMNWVNAGEETTLRLTKSLSVKTSHSEQEVPDSRAVVKVLGKSYRKSRVEGQLNLTNYRNEVVKMHIKREISGDLIKATDDPVLTLRKEGVWSLNKLNNLCWDIELKPGEEKKISYSYEVFVRD